MKETLQIPTPEALEALIGKELYDISVSYTHLTLPTKLEV